MPSRFIVLTEYMTDMLLRINTEYITCYASPEEGFTEISMCTPDECEQHWTVQETPKMIDNLIEYLEECSSSIIWSKIAQRVDLTSKEDF